VRAKIPVAVAALFAIAQVLSGCDTIAQGYVNRLSRAVTIVEHPGPKIHPFTLTPGQVSSPGFGRNPRTFDVIAPGGRLIATYRPSDLAVSGREFYRYVVIDSRGAHIETTAEMLKSPE
jgi:hypothetical protein